MVRQRVPYEVRARFFDLVCTGWSLAKASSEVGVAKQSAWEWWRKSAPVTLELLPGRVGGIDSARTRLSPGAAGEAGVGQRRMLTSEDRAVIAACLQCRARGEKITLAQIGELIERHKSVIGREIARNSGPDGSYYGALAHQQAVVKRKRPKEFRLVAEPGLCRRIEAWMDDGWSPQLIARVLREESPHTIMGRVSHETIYQALYVQTRGGLRKDLYRQLSTKRAARKPQGGVKRANSPYKEAFKISQRPPEVADRAVPGHWEGDLIMGSPGSPAVGTLVERATRFTILLHLPGSHDAESVAEAMIREMSQLPEHLRRSLTWDRGTELAAYAKIQTDLSMPVYFCDPHSPWQRGTNENTNRLLRHWLTKGSDLSRFTAADLRRIAASLNARPRPTLDMKTPAQALDALLSNPAAA
ncbi:IS30 family transposase [Nocardioides nitrophenolicus]|uniref:IS30 family transposase n=1 Tax=Nocardioides nitrophenolicus TaxID=60489 RepID=UPI00195C47E7|nr:IS30 family transposase [Nocardioides nitrophenolicus]